MSDLIALEALINLGYNVFKSLTKRHAVNSKFISKNISDQFNYCLDIAINAFIEHINTKIDLNKTIKALLLNYFKSKEVTEELSKLLDPGFEIFDPAEVSQKLLEMLQSEEISNISLTNILEAWENFLKAFSFSSRSANDLRNFLKASYEAGNFKALTDINQDLKNIEDLLELSEFEEKKLKEYISRYLQDLSEAKEWAKNFKVIKTV